MVRAYDPDRPIPPNVRDRLIHGYFGVDHALVWDVVQQRIPPLQQAIRRILNSSPA